MSSLVRQSLLVLLNLVCVCVVALWCIVLVDRMQAREGAVHDFVQEWTSARSYYDGKPIYGDLTEVIPKYLGRPYDDVVRVNAHPPTSILLVLPLGKQPYSQAYFLWNLISIAALIVSCGMILRELKYSPWAVMPLAALVITSNSLAQQVNQGQLNLLLLLTLTCSWLAWRRDRWATAGAIVGVMAAIKVFPGFLVLYFLARKKWSGAIAVVGGFSVATAITGAVLGWECYWDYAFRVTPSLGVFRDYWPNASIVGFWTKLFDPQSGHVTPLANLPWLAKTGAVISMAAIAGVTAWRAHRAKTNEEYDLTWSLAICGMLLASPITWDHYFLLLIPCLLIQWRMEGMAGRTVLCFLCFGLLTVYPKWIWDVGIAGDGELAVGPGRTKSIATPLHAATLLAYQCYLLLGWFVLAARSRDKKSEHNVEPE